MGVWWILPGLGAGVLIGWGTALLLAERSLLKREKKAEGRERAAFAVKGDRTEARRREQWDALINYVPGGRGDRA